MKIERSLNSKNVSMNLDRDVLQSDAAENPPESFSKMLSNSIGEVNRLLAQADEANASLVTGKSENLHEAMISTEKAETALKFLVQVRNKALEAYHEVLRMQV